MRKLSILLFFIPLVSMAQDSLSIKGKGVLSGQWRTYYMGTINKSELKDYNALAAGGMLKYTYQIAKGMELGAAMYNSNNLGLQDLALPDQTTGKLSRYEEGLFDRLNLSNDAIFLLGELYFKYELKGNTITLGRMKVNTPLINPQDGRMIPTLVQGIWFKHITGRSSIFQLGIFNQIAPRSTGEFYGIGESIGTYPVGTNRYGEASEYSGNTRSDYIILMNANIKLTTGLYLGIWNFYTENIFNSLYIKPKLQVNQGLTLEGEWLHQHKIRNGGNAIDSLRYFNQNTSDVLGLKIEYRKKATTLSLGYDRVFAGGQFLSPREWGREDLFSFQKRERSEGTADSHSLVFNYSASWALIQDKANVRSMVSLGRHWKPDVTDAILNKYAVPDYTHLNLDLLVNFKKLKGLKLELLFTAKLANGDFPDNPNFYYNKTDMLHLSAVINYNF